MSGRTSKRNASSNSKLDLGGSYPQELKAEHRQLLVRSLARNDVDLAALTKVNESLRKSKTQIIEACGEPVLLDLGSGKLTMVNDELHHVIKESKDPKPYKGGEETKDGNISAATATETEVYTLTPLQKQMCVDFLLRMQLRRRLANRLVRRLNRIAQAMDGGDVAPPPPPRYGDLRLHMDRMAVNHQVQFWTQQKQLKDKWEHLLLETKKEKEDILPAMVTSRKTDETEKAVPMDGVAGSVLAEEEKQEQPTEDNASKEEGLPTEGDGAADPTPMAVDSSTATASALTKDETPEETASEINPEAVASATDADVFSTTGKAVISDDSLNSPPALQDEFALLREYNNAYDKVWNPVTKDFQYVLVKEADQAPPPDYLAIKGGMAIGATTRLLSEQEREQEYKRWQTSILTRIPAQPTREELGLNHRVFYLEERRKRYHEAIEEEEDEADNAEDETDQPDSKKQKVEEDDMEVDTDKEAPDDMQDNGDDKATKEEDDEEEKAEKSSKKQKTKKDSDDDDDTSSSDMFGEEEDEEDEGKRSKKSPKINTKDGDDSSDMFGEDSDGNADDDDGEKEEKMEKKPEGKEPKKIKLEPRKKKEDEEKEQKEKEAAVEEPKRIRPMSLAAVPSFYEQDLNRIRAVHGDLMSSSILEHARRQMADATNDYNKAFRASSQLFEHRARLQQNLAYFAARSKTELAKASNEYALQVAVAKQRWLKQKIEHDKKRAQQFLPSNWGRAPFGTNATQNYQRLGGISGVVGQTIADVVDGAIIMLEGKIPNNKFDDFVPPANPHTNQKTGETLVQQHQLMDKELKRQMQDISIKLQASEEERQRAWTKMMKTKAEIEPTNDPMGKSRGRIDLSNYHLIPLPQLRGSGLQQVPREFLSRAALAAYTPPKAINSVSDPRYSAAVVKERPGLDGIVAPVDVARRAKDGMYMRPAGKARKGMKWDAVRGIWISGEIQ